MSQIEATQVKLRLINEKDILPDGVSGKEVLHEINKRKKNPLWKTDASGKYISIMFDAMEFKFRPGKTLTAGKVVANALRRSSALMIGPDYLNGPIEPIIIVEKEFVIGDEDGSDAPPMSATSCPVCFKDQKTLPKLSRHLEGHKADHPELFNEPDGIPWEGTENPASEADGSDDADEDGTEKE